MGFEKRSKKKRCQVRASFSYLYFNLDSVVQSFSSTF